MAYNSSFEEFCGGRFWDQKLTWETEEPNFTPCFQNSVLIWVPCGWLWFMLIPYSIALSHSNSPSINNNWKNITKTDTPATICGILLAILAILDIIKSAQDRSEGLNPPLILFVSPGVLAATELLAVILIQVERKKGYVTSGVLFIFWTLLLVAGIIPFYSKILEVQKNNGVIPDVFRFTTFYIYYAMIIAQWILSCIADTRPREEYRSQRECPEVRASFLSRITFWWIDSMVRQGYRKTLEEDDICELNERDVTANTAPMFEKAWQDEMLDSGLAVRSSKGVLVQRQISNYGTLGKPSLTDSMKAAASKLTGGKHKASQEETPLLGSKGSSNPSAKPLQTREPSIFWALTKCYGLTLFKAQCCKLVYDILTFVGPILQSQVISFTEDKSTAMWKGYVFAALFFVSGTVQSLFFHQLFHIGMTLGMRIKSAAINIVYKKALTMSNEARKGTTVGEIVNLMSVDAQRLQDVTGYIWMMWSCPLQIGIAIYMLWGIVGPSSLAGLAVMILLIPVNGVLATIQRRLQIAQMKQKDQRIKLMNEVLNGIKVLKLYAWELSFQDKINVIRNMELETLKRYSYLMAVGTFTWTCAPFLVTLATFLSFVLSGNVLDSNTAFVSLSLFNILRFPINLLPMMMSYIVTAMVSIKRLGKFLQQGDIDLDNVSRDETAPHPLTIERGTFAWGTTDEDLPALKNVNLSVKDNELLAVVGAVGSGKSSLLSAFLGEMEKFSGHVNIRGSVAYVPQQAWIQNATVRENILFGLAYDEEKYNKVLETCALKADLEILPGGDMTEIGEKGINLSGGQKQRISLARAVYSNKDIYLLDDPLSAVDAHVGKHIFEKVVGPTGVLKGKTRVLVTHGVQWLPQTDRVVVLLNGDISEMGTYEELLSHDGAFANFLKTYLLTEDSESDDEDPEIAELKDKILERVESVTVESAGGKTSQSESESAVSSDTGLKRRISRKKSKTDRQTSRKKSTIVEEKKEVKEEKPGEKLIEKEVSESGGVKWGIFYAYLKSLGLFLAILLIFFFLLYQVFSVLSNVWLSSWTEDSILKNDSIANTTVYTNQRDFYLGVYGALGGAQAFFVLIYAIISAVSMVRASRKMHANLLSNILRSSMAFFDTTPIGRILNRFSRDIETIDNILPNMLKSWINTFFTVMSTVIVISYSTPIFLTVVIPLFILYYFIQRFYVPTSRQLKRIESTSRSPIYTHFSETISGASTIRAYRDQDRFNQKTDDLVDHNLAYYFYSIASNRWLGFRLEFLGSAVVFAAAMFAVVSRDTISGGIVGLSISYALQITSSLNWMVRMTSDLETNIVSVERIVEYSETPTEADWYIDETRPPRGWPAEGRIAFEEYRTRYREGLDLVLKGITANIQGGEKVGIVGRTGAGKSSLTLALFRIIEAAGGSIMIDGVHIGNLGLHQLRGKLTILPQDPVLFSGTLRMNLDPFDRFTDDEIWMSLQQAHLKEFVAGLPQGLTYECGEGGQNLSVGQRQLVCLGRTLLHKTKILVLDEATAAVDLETDELIQNTIRREFSDCTIITIAHRINTILDNDRVMVLDAGTIVEFDNPTHLLKNKSSIFYAMAKDAGITN